MAAAQNAQNGQSGAALRCVAALVSVVAAATLVSLARTPTLPGFVLPATLTLAAAAAVRPAAALLGLAVLVPSIGWFGARLEHTVVWPELAVMAFLIGWGSRVAWRRPAGRMPSIAAIPAILLAALVAGSMLIDVADIMRRLGGTEASAILRDYVFRDYYRAGTEMPGLHAGRRLLEGLGLFWAAASLSATGRRFRTSLAAAVVIGAALAASLTILELVWAARRSDAFWATLAGLFAAVRHNAPFADVNAAGSHYVLVVLLAAALTMVRRPHSLGWSALAVLVGAGLWLSGSRAALLAAVVATPLWLALALAPAFLRDRRRAGVAALAMVILVAGGVAALLLAPLRPMHVAWGVAAQVRFELAKTSVRMTGEAPVFGVGVGHFPLRSGEFSSPELLATWPGAARENAHNQFLQILAELGVTGLAAFLALLAVVLAAGVRSANSDTLTAGAAAGLTAFLITCLAGHPLLIPQVAFTFWLVLGLLAGIWPRPPDRGQRPRRSTVLLTVALLAIAASMPGRAAHRLRNANLEHMGIGVSLWQTAEDGTRYREAIGRGAIFVPNTDRFRFQLRAEAPHPVDVELHLAGRLANIVTLQPGEWQDMTMMLNPDPSRGRFLRLEIVAHDSVPLWITKIEPLPAR